MKTRTLTGAGLIVTLLLALWVGGWVFALLWLTAVGLALSEMLRVLAAAGHRPLAWPAWAVLASGLPSFLLMSPSDGMRFVLAVTLLCCLLATAFVLFRSAPRLEDLLLSLLPLMTVSGPGLCMLALNPPMTGQRALLALAFFIPILGDSVAYLVGVRYGRTRLNPPVSPSKTLEGAAAGLAGSLAAAMGVYLVWAALGGALPPAWHFLLLGLLGGLAGQVGDLFASLVKRYCAVKDFGSLFPGHGGMMDRLDSILFTASLVFAYRFLFL